MSALSEFFLHSSPAVVYIEGIEITHSAFSGTHRLVRNANSLALTHEDTIDYDYTYVPLRIKTLASNTDLGQEMEITIGDLGDIIATELQNVSDANKMYEKPIVTYRCWRSDDLTEPLFGPVRLRIDGLSLTKEGAAFRAKAASYNIVRTGETYRVERFPMLEALL